MWDIFPDDWMAETHEHGIFDTEHMEHFEGTYEEMPHDMPHFDEVGINPDDPGWLAGTPHVHLTGESDAVDMNGNGISDAVERDLGLDPLADPELAIGRFGFEGADTDHDLWPDWVEDLVGTNTIDPHDHPEIVEAHHFPAGSGENLAGSFDIELPPMP